MVNIDLRFTMDFVKNEEWENFQPFISNAHQRLHAGQVAGSDYLGWIHLPSQTLESGIEDILESARQIQEIADAIVVIGIGGSYLGARAAYEWLKPDYYNQLSANDRGGPEIYFAGNHLSGSALHDLLTILEGKRVVINAISKSGTTTEPAVAFRILRDWLISRVGQEEAKRRIYITTDRARGALKQLAETEGYKTFVIPDDVGGRYSVLTPVGLLPLSAIGVDIRALLQGAAEAEDMLQRHHLRDNGAYQYAAVRNALYRKGKNTEILAYYEPSLRMFAEWWKQLFGESEGKDQKGIYPSSVGYTTDLHSLGQFVQEGYRNLFETVIRVDAPKSELHLPSATDVNDGLEYLSDKPLSWINDQARIATQLAHGDGGVPNILLSVPDQSERSLGELFYFFEAACAMSGQLLGVNAFNQPGVEAYKTNMFALLGKPGHEAQTKALHGRLGHTSK
jgi:glucose-6-phosphate isomerase